MVRSKSFIVQAVCAGALVSLSPQVEAVAFDNFAQVDAFSGLSNQDLVDGMLAMAQDGVIRIPIKKEETGFLSQIYAQADSASFGTDPHGEMQLT